MTFVPFTVSQTTAGNIWTGTATADTVYVAAGVALIDTDFTTNFDALLDWTANGLALQIYGSVVGDYPIVMFGTSVSIVIGAGGAVTGANTAITCGTTSWTMANAGQVTSSGGIGINASGSGVINNSGAVEATGGAGIYMAGSGSITNSGAVDSTNNVGVDIHPAAASVAIVNSGRISGNWSGVAITDSTATDIHYVTNTGSISGFAGLADFGAHTAIVSNTGTISTTAGGNGVTADAGVVEQLTNGGTINGTVSLKGLGSTLTDSGAINGSVTLAGAAAGAAATDVRITVTGVLTSLGSTALTLSAGEYNIVNSGELTASQDPAHPKILVDGIDVHATGSLTNNGKIEAAAIGVSNDAVSNNIAVLYNYGAIAGNGRAVSDTGGHWAYVYNFGAIVGGGVSQNYAVYADSSTYELLRNSGTISGGAQLLANSSGIVNTGLIDSVDLAGAASVVKNAGTIGYLTFESTAANARLINSGTVVSAVASGGLNTQVANSGVIQSNIGINGLGSSFSNSGKVEGAVGMAGAAAGGPATNVRIFATGVVNSTASISALSIAAGVYDIVNAGEIDASVNGANTGTVDGIEVHGAGVIVNSGKISAATFGVSNDDATTTDVVFLYNHGLISGTAGGVSDTGGHVAKIYNSGAIDGGAGGVAVGADSATVEQLNNSGAINGGVTLAAAGSAIGNSGSITGAVSLTGARFVNRGVVVGDVIFAGSGNVYNGLAGAVTGTIRGAGADGVYWGGADGATFDMTASGARLVVGGTGADTFVFAASGLTAATTLRGGDGSAIDTLQFASAGAIGAIAFLHVSGVEEITLANGINGLTLTEALVASANGSALTVLGGGGADAINARLVTGASDHLSIQGGGGADTIYAGASSETFVYAAASESTGPGYDTLWNVNFGSAIAPLDVFDIPGAPGTIQAVNPAVTAGALSTLTFNADLAAAIGAAQLGAHDAVLFKASSGTLAGQTFLVVDLNGAAGYQANADLVMRLVTPTGTLTSANFV